MGALHILAGVALPVFAAIGNCAAVEQVLVQLQRNPMPIWPATLTWNSQSG